MVSVFAEDVESFVIFKVWDEIPPPAPTLPKIALAVAPVEKPSASSINVDPLLIFLRSSCCASAEREKEKKDCSYPRFLGV